MKVFCLTMFILLHIHEIPPIQLVQIVVSGHTPGLQLSHLVECFLGVLQGVCHGLDVRPDVMWCTANELALECQPVDGDLTVCLLRVLVLFHHDVGWSEPSNLHQVRLTGIPPEEDLLAQVELHLRFRARRSLRSASASSSAFLAACLLVRVSSKSGCPPR